MFIDLRTLDDNSVLEADICIVGAGPAGISMARSLIGTNIDVLVIESGDMDYDDDTQALYQGESVGVPYFGLDEARLRFFGGSSNHWDNWCGEFQPIDFQQRSWVPYSGWPFGPEELEPWYDLARPICSLGPRRTNADIWDKLNVEPIVLDESRLKFHFWEIATPTRFGEVYREELRTAPNVCVLLNANATECVSNAAAHKVDSVELVAFNGRRARVKARQFVLACGAIENARLMLASDRIEPHGIGNRRDLVGRFFMEHPRDRIGSLTTSDPFHLIDMFRPGWFGEHVFCPSITVPAEKTKTEQILNTRLQLLYVTDETSMATMRRFAQSIAAGHVPDRLAEGLWDLIQGTDITAYNLYRRAIHNRPMVPKPDGVHQVYFLCQAEQAPNPDSRITLSDRRDALGSRLPVLDWRLGELDKRTLQVQGKLLGGELARLGLGLFQFDPWLREGGTSWSPSMVGGYHQMGTTRMSDDERTGVVDANCRVHGLDNLYVAGSSVYPTGSNINPTLTLVALALRLSDHLKQRLTERA
ncbi:MAG TPA: GMC family oxidoreductase [Skermanella sp.]|nr:GMC family oxidoreductase [Skermanella sp.]